MFATTTLYDRGGVRLWRAALRERGRTLVFTNGCFDILHVGHIQLLEAAAGMGDTLLVALNSDASIRRLKGMGRPVVPLEERAEVVAALRCVDRVVAFDEDTPQDLITLVVPDILVKGGDWTPDRIVGREVVEGSGGKVVVVPLVAGRSTSDLLRRIRTL